MISEICVDKFYENRCFQNKLMEHFWYLLECILFVMYFVYFFEQYNSGVNFPFKHYWNFALLSSAQEEVNPVESSLILVSLKACILIYILESRMGIVWHISPQRSFFYLTVEGDLWHEIMKYAEIQEDIE